MFRVAVFLVASLGCLSTAFSYVVASDNSGKYMFAANGNSVIISTDHGEHWKATQNGDTHFDVSADSSGNNLIIAARCNPRLECSFPTVTKNAGYSWATIPNESSEDKLVIFSVASNASGDKRVVSTGLGIYMSTDAGNSWSMAPLLGVTGTPVAFAADGSKFVYSRSNLISFHSNGFYVQTPSRNAAWHSFGTDATGRVIAGCYSEGHYAGGGLHRAVMLSLDGGASYSELALNSNGTEMYDVVVVSDDGSIVVYGGSHGLSVHYITERTTTKSDLNSAIISIAASSTGRYIVAASKDNIWVSSNYGVNFRSVSQ